MHAALADPYAAYGSNLEAGLDGDLDADDAAATFNDHYYSARAEMYQEEYDPLRDDDSDYERDREAPCRRRYCETPSSTLYVRVSPACPRTMFVIMCRNRASTGQGHLDAELSGRVVL